MPVLLDIVFQSGEFHNEGGSWFLELLNTILGAAIGSGVTVWALYKTFKHDKEKENSKQLAFQKQKLKYFRSLIQITLSTLQSQIMYYKEFVEEINADPIMLPMLKMATFNELDQIVHKLNQEDYYHSYLGQFGDNKITIDEFRDIITMLNYFESVISLHHKGLNQSINLDYERKVTLKDLIENIMDEAAGLLRNRNTSQPDFWHFLNDKMLNFYNNQNGNTSLKHYHENFIEVLRSDELLNHARNIIEAHNLLIKARNASMLYKEIQQHNKGLAEDFTDLHNKIDSTLKKFEVSAKRILEENI